MLILYSALSIPLALAMNGGRGPVVGMCGLFPSLLMDCVDVWLDGWMGLADQLLLPSSSSSLACVCVGCVNGPGLWLSSECATLTSGYSMRMAGWPIRIDNRLVGRGEVVMILLALASGDGGWNRCSASANGWNMVFG